MAFKGMSERFEAHVDQLYNRYSARGPDGVGQPFFEIKPNDPSKDDTKNDTRLSPGKTGDRDRIRIEKFLTSGDGARFLLKQAELQTGNTFSETRLFNPLSSFGRIRPNWVRIPRSIGNATGDSPGSSESTVSSIVKNVLNDKSTSKSPASDASMGSAGRLQRETANKAKDRVLGRTGPTGLLNLLPPNKITRIVSAAGSLLETGILGVNERPELNLDGQYYSVAMWAGFVRSGQNQSKNFIKAGNAIRKGDIKGAIVNIGKGIVDTAKRSLIGSKGIPVPTAARAGRNEIDRSDLNGLRYFIVNDQDADRYLQNAVQDSKAAVEFLNRQPYLLTGESVFLSGLPTKLPSISKIAQKEKSALQTQSKKKSLLSKIGGFIKGAVKVLVGGTSLPGTNIRIGPTNPTTGRLLSGATTTNPTSGNPAEERMLFGELSLANRYETTDGPVSQIKEMLEYQSNQSLESIRKLKTESTYNLGYVGGIQLGNKIVDDGGIFASKNTKVDGGRYFSDGAVVLDAILTNTDNDQNTRVIDQDIKNQIRDIYKDSIDFMFHDYVNNKIIPFRAILSQMSENITTDFDTQRYIGRVERNVVYSGATRELTFTFYIQAFSKNELDFIWQKINYLTGLCFPSTYADGFMVPPFVQLTIGNLYVDQPGYIKSITHTIEDNTSWDIDSDAQVPMGMTVNVSFSTIEKTQVRSGYGFYGIGSPVILSTSNKNNGTPVGIINLPQTTANV